MTSVRSPVAAAHFYLGHPPGQQRATLLVPFGEAERAEPVDGIEGVELVVAGLRAHRVVGQDLGSQVELIGQKGQDLFRHDLARMEKASRIAKGAELNGKAEAVVGSAPSRDHGQVDGGQGVVPDEIGFVPR